MAQTSSISSRGSSPPRLEWPSFASAFDAAPFPIRPREAMNSFIPEPPTCSVCSQYHRPVPEAFSSSPGYIGRLSSETLPEKSVFWEQSHMNEDASNHPAAVIKLSRCGHLSFCLQCTSKPLDVKYANAHPITRDKLFHQYMPLHTNGTSKRYLAKVGGLEISSPMKHETSANLTRGFWIERDLLARIRDAPTLTTDAVEKACWAYEVVNHHRERCNIAAMEPALLGARARSVPPRGATSPPRTHQRCWSAPPVTMLPRREPTPPQVGDCWEWIGQRRNVRQRQQSQQSAKRDVMAMKSWR